MTIGSDYDSFSLNGGELMFNKAQEIITLENKIIYVVEDNKINMLLAKTLVKQVIPNATIIECVYFTTIHFLV